MSEWSAIIIAVGFYFGLSSIADAINEFARLKKNTVNNIVLRYITKEEHEKECEDKANA